eukprot:GHVR01103311.1.p2 GENE.GHVR01103311.1~~GHVR01103311.1.p2  ORF type:complete len:258 (+),score=28.46 GHVR01103311.1:1715-2488(+)
MTLQEFINKWNGKGLDADGAYGNQCVDVAKQYCHEVLGIEGLHGNAIDWKNNTRDNLVWVNNTETNVPQAGDIVIWSGGSVGHIAVFVDGNASSFNSFDQNWPVGSTCHIQSHTYKGATYNVIGWLHFVAPQPPVVVPPVEPPKPPVIPVDPHLARISELEADLSLSEVEVASLKIEINNCKQQISELTTNCKQKDDQIKTMQTDAETMQKQMEEKITLLEEHINVSANYVPTNYVPTVQESIKVLLDAIKNYFKKK